MQTTHKLALIVGASSGLLTAASETLLEASFFILYDFWLGADYLSLSLSFILSGVFFGLGLIFLLKSYDLSVLKKISVVLVSVASYLAAVYSPFLTMFLFIDPSIIIFFFIFGSLIASVIIVLGIKIVLKKSLYVSRGWVWLFVLPLLAVSVSVSLLTFLEPDTPLAPEGMVLMSFLFTLHPLWQATMLLGIAKSLATPQSPAM